jgi:alkanesulfonate monooxygenase SsuD/methylene tetrahydromethanopterin reductase-like flavin-dependent oxidoreductase (luciferase family)
MVLVAPWYQPLRLAEEIAMLSLMTRSGVHLGLGRGSAAMEYEAFGMDLDESRDRFRETVEIVQGALSGRPFTYDGRYNSVREPVVLRPLPRRDRITLYGAISSQPSARIMADLDLPLFCNAVRPLDMHRAVLDEWHAVTAAAGRDVARPRLLQGHLIVADTDAEAAALAREHLPQFFQAQVDHYRTDLDKYDRLKTFDMRRMAAMRERFSNPANLDDFIDLQFIGSPRTIRNRLQGYAELGFDKFVVTTNTPGIPQALRHHWLTRFATEVAPEFSAAFGNRQAA